MNTNKYLILAIGGLFTLALAIFTALLGYPLAMRLLSTPPAVVEDPGDLPPPAVIVTATPYPTLPVVEPSETQEPTLPAEPTDTPEPTKKPTEVAQLCDLAGFVLDVTVPDGSDFIPDAEFVKTWRLKNLGSCTWTTEYDLYFGGGSKMGAPQSVSLPQYVLPGQIVDVSVRLTAPEEAGDYRGYWFLKNAKGDLFGMGDKGKTPFWADIDVVLPCNWAAFVKDVTIKDNTLLSAGTKFTKIWRLKNIGSCTWTKSYDLVFEDGHELNAEKLVIALPEKVKPGETIDLPVNLTAPSKAGDYRGYWMLRDEDGKRFGLGDDRKTAFWVDIKVISPATSFYYDLTANFCLADWQSGAGDLECTQNKPDKDGFVRWIAEPRLENRTENEPALWLHPNESKNGWISGEYPAIYVRQQDHFKAWVGCLAGSEGCDVKFQLDYRIDGGPVLNLGTWHEVYDGQVTEIDIDLSSLQGKQVQLILSVQVNNDPGEADAFWFAPRIEGPEFIIETNTK